MVQDLAIKLPAQATLDPMIRSSIRFGTGRSLQQQGLASVEHDRLTCPNQNLDLISCWKKGHCHGSTQLSPDGVLWRPTMA